MEQFNRQIGRRNLLAGTAVTGLVAAGLLTGAGPASATTTDPILNDGLNLPRRIFDSRNTAAPNSGRFTPGTTRTIGVDIGPTQSETANHVFLSVTVTGTTGAGYLAIYPSELVDPFPLSCLNWFGPNQTLASGILTRCTIARSTAEPAYESFIKVACRGGGSAQVILDLTARWT